MAKTDLESLRNIFKEEKFAKQVLNAAKRATKKRRVDGDSTPSTPKRHRRTQASQDFATPAQLESSLALPFTKDEDVISETVVVTNRAPLVLAFAFVLLKYTMPEQPPSGRLSLAQAVVSANSRSKAVSLGIANGPSPEEEGWAQGQPMVKVLGREISVLKRPGYSWKEQDSENEAQTSTTISAETAAINEDAPPLWGLDLEALRRSNGRIGPGSALRPNSTLPIYKADAARDYLLRSFSFGEDTSLPTPGKKTRKPAEIASDREKCLGLLLGAIDLLCQSWSTTLSKDDLDRRAWAWYVKVRPEIQSGPSGWGQKGTVPLSMILELRK